VIRGWYGDSNWVRLLAPFAHLYQAVVRRRRFRYLAGRSERWRAPVPVIVVGNITVGGTGKTPFVIWLSRWLAARGFRPGIVSRGYGGRRSPAALFVTQDSDPDTVGDEASLLARRTGCPVVVAADRVEAVRRLVDETTCDIVISDDGLQHYALSRDVEIVLIDGERGFGNGRSLPAGPLREPVSRLREVDFVVANGCASGSSDREWVMEVVPRAFVNLRSGERVQAADFRATRVHAVAGIGNPERFFATLRKLGIGGEFIALDDHHRFSPGDLAFDDDAPVVMTEKDATKVTWMTQDDLPAQCWYLEIDVVLSERAEAALADCLAARGIAGERSRMTEVQ
jgi:tetraacyldisaccharide 4'-kinase